VRHGMLRGHKHADRDGVAAHSSAPLSVQMRQPLVEMNLYSSWVMMLGSERGRPLNLKYLVQKQVLRWLLGWRPTPMAAHRVCLLTWRRSVA